MKAPGSTTGTLADDQVIAPARIESIEILRGIAVAGAVMAHMSFLVYWNPPWLANLMAGSVFGHGVILFFVISGFVVARDLLPRLEQAQASPQFWRETRAFWLRRVWRILPSAWLWASIGLLASWLFNQSGVFGTVRGNLNDFLAVITHTANLFRYTCHADPAPCGYNGVFWTLSLEEQFYLALPLVVFAGRGQLGRLIIALILLQLMIALWPGPHQIFFSVIRMDSMLMGVALAIGWRRIETSNWLHEVSVRPFILYGGIAVLCLPLFWVPSWVFSVPFLRLTWMHWSQVSCLLMIVLACLDRREAPVHGPIHRVMAWVGKRSFGIYLIHLPVFAALRELLHRASWTEKVMTEHHQVVLVLLGIGLTLLISEINYRYFENPLRLHGAAAAARYRSQTSVRITPEQTEPGGFRAG